MLVDVLLDVLELVDVVDVDVLVVEVDVDVVVVSCAEAHAPFT